MNKQDEITVRSLLKEKVGVFETDKVEFQRLGGLTNRNYKVETNAGSFVFRLPGEGTEEMINRRDEYLCTKLTNDIGIDSELIFFDLSNGIKIARFIEEAETMNSEKVRNIENMEAIAGIFKTLHTSGGKVPVEFNVFEKIEEYENLLKKAKGEYFWEDYKDIREMVYGLKGEVLEMGIQNTICHNDPLCENFIQGKDRMYLVDWEYAGMNDPMWDIADFFIEAGFSKEEEEIFSAFYFDEKPDEALTRRILMNKVFLDFLWSLWGKQRYSCGEDLLEYANERYERAKLNLNLLAN